jgi:hypothetical protein
MAHATQRTTHIPGKRHGEDFVDEEPASKKAKLVNLPWANLDELKLEANTFVDTSNLPPLHATKKRGPHPSLIFLRPAVIDILQVLEGENSEVQWMRGTPGDGKSQLGRLWACSQAVERRVVYAEARDGAYWLTWIKNKKWKQREVLENEFLQECRNESHVSDQLVVLDGVVRGSPTEELACYMLKGEARVFVITSGQASLKGEGTPDLVMPGWTLKELCTALDREDFFNQTVLMKEVSYDERKAFLAAKYNVVGPSARLMFEFTLDKAKSVFDEALGHAMSDEEKKQLLLGVLPEGHEKAQNVLVQALQGTGKQGYSPGDMIQVFASQYVLQQLRHVLGLADAKRLYAHCKTLHRVIEGWAFEELVLKMLEERPNSFRVRQLALPGDEGKEEWRQVPVVTFDCARFFADVPVLVETDTVTPIEITNPIVLRPNKTNNASWDAVLVEKVDGVWRLTFLEITLQDIHTLNEMKLWLATSKLVAGVPGQWSLKVRSITVTQSTIQPQSNLYARTPNLLDYRSSVYTRHGCRFAISGLWMVKYSRRSVSATMCISSDAGRTRPPQSLKSRALLLVSTRWIEVLVADATDKLVQSRPCTLLLGSRINYLSSQIAP